MREGVEKDLSPAEALTQEIRNIDLIRSDASISLFAASTLDLTRAFYATLLESPPRDWSNWTEVVTGVLADVQDAVLAVHVPEIG